jgi:hypothetical protein
MYQNLRRKFRSNQLDKEGAWTRSAVLGLYCRPVAECDMAKGPVIWRWLPGLAELPQVQTGIAQLSLSPSFPHHAHFAVNHPTLHRSLYAASDGCKTRGTICFHSSGCPGFILMDDSRTNHFGPITQSNPSCYPPLHMPPLRHDLLPTRL